MKSTLNIFLSLIVLSAFWMSCNDKKADQKFAYVRSADLIYKYKGMEEATTKYKKQAEEWQGNLEAMKKEYDEAVAKFNQGGGKSAADADKIKKMEENLNKY